MNGFLKPGVLIVSLAFGGIMTGHAQASERGHAQASERGHAQASERGDAQASERGDARPSSAEMRQFERALERNPRAAEALVRALQAREVSRAHAITSEMMSDTDIVEPLGGPYCPELGLYLPPFLCWLWGGAAEQFFQDQLDAP